MSLQELLPGQVNNTNYRTPVSVNTNVRSGLVTLPNKSSLLDPDWVEYARDGDLDEIKRMENPITTDDEGRTPLHYAAANGHNDIVKFLLEKGQDISQADKVGLTPLHQAAMRAKVSTVELLLSKGANTEAKDANGNTPLNLVNKTLEGRKLGGRVRIMNETVKTNYQIIQGMLIMYAAKGGRRCTRKRSKRSKRSRSRSRRQSRKN
jgi:hypothetical protein